MRHHRKLLPSLDQEAFETFKKTKATSKDWELANKLRKQHLFL